MIFKLPSNLTALINLSQISHNKLDGKKIKKDLNKKDNLIKSLIKHLVSRDIRGLF